MFNMAKEIINVLKQTELLGHQFSVYGTAEEPLFLAKEVASIIGHTNPSKMLDMVDEDERVKIFGVIELTNGYKPCESATYNGANYLFVTESGLYELLMQSRTEQAKMFKSGVKEILKTIRKTGGYIATTEEDSPEEIMAKALLVAQTTIRKKEERMRQLEAETEQQRETIELQDTEIKKAAPKVNYYDNHLQSVNTQTTTQVAKQIGMEAPKLNKKLKELGILYKQSGQWLLHSPYSSWGMHSTRTQTFTRSDGSTGTSVYTVWTTKGVRFIIALYENDWNVKKAIKQIKGELNPAA